MTYREAWEDIYFKHCQETCDYAYMDNCQEEKCEYYMALQALNRQYYAECGSVWVKPKADRKTEPTISKMEQVDKDINVRSKDEPQTCDDCIWSVCNYNKAFEDEPQTETEIAKAIVHKMIDDAVIAEDAYPDLRQKMHDAVDEYEPQTERSE